jgi:hypothetical protein
MRFAPSVSEPSIQSQISHVVTPTLESLPSFACRLAVGRTRTLSVAAYEAVLAGPDDVATCLVAITPIVRDFTGTRE